MSRGRGTTYFFLLLVVGILLPAGFALAQAGAAPPTMGGPDEFGGWATDQLVVKFSAGALQQPVASARGQNPSAHPIPHVMMTPALQGLCAAWGVRGIRRAYPYPFGHPQLAAQLGLDRFYILEVARGTDTPAMGRAFCQCGSAEIESAGAAMVGGIAQTFPNESNPALGDFNMQYGLHNTGQLVAGLSGVVDADIDAPEAWDIETGFSNPVTIAFIDSGIDASHIEFAGRIIPGTNANDPINNPNLTIDENGHGTHVAGIAAAEGNNGVGVAGVTWGAKLMPVRVVDAGGLGSAADAAAGLIWAVDHGADICNMSLQYCSAFRPGVFGPPDSPQDLAMLDMAIDYAYAQGVLVVAAAGNSICAVAGNPPSNVSLPGRNPNAIAVGATTSKDLLASQSGTGPEVELSAAGSAVWSTWPVNRFAFLSGTSMATPFVSGVAALLKSHAPYLTHQQIRDLLTTTAVDLGPVGRDSMFGFGRVNAFAALLAVPPPPISILSSFPPDGAIDAGQPSNIDGTNPTGWSSVDITFDGDASAAVPGDFVVTVDPPQAVPIIQSVVANGNTVTLSLSTFIPVAAWTTFTHASSGTSIRLGYLPGDVNGSRQSNAQDITSLIDALNGVGSALDIWSIDVDRSTAANAQDITVEINLLNGAMALSPFNGVSLP